MVCDKCGEPDCLGGRDDHDASSNCRNCGWPGDYRGPLSRGRPRGDRRCADCLGPTYVEPSGDVVCGMDPRHRVPATRREGT